DAHRVTSLPDESKVMPYKTQPYLSLPPQKSYAENLKRSLTRRAASPDDLCCSPPSPSPPSRPKEEKPKPEEKKSLSPEKDLLARTGSEALLGEAQARGETLRGPPPPPQKEGMPKPEESPTPAPAPKPYPERNFTQLPRRRLPERRKHKSRRRLAQAPVPNPSHQKGPRWRRNLSQRRSRHRSTTLTLAPAPAFIERGKPYIDMTKSETGDKQTPERLDSLGLSSQANSLVGPKPIELPTDGYCLGYATDDNECTAEP
ncbi:hypothetical protein EDB84DRAFT_1443692, partial [Lactarius hengduanensis]